MKFITAAGSKFVSGKHQLGNKVWCKVKFRTSGTFTFDVFIENDRATAYTTTEVPNNKFAHLKSGTPPRNMNFLYKEIHRFTREAKAENNNEVIISGNDLFLSQAGGNTYTIKAKSTTAGHGKVSCTTKIFSKRMLFYSEVKMDESSPTAEYIKVEELYKSHHLVLAYAGKRILTPAESSDYVKNIDTKDTVQLQGFRNLVKMDSVLDPYHLWCVYVGSIASKKGAKKECETTNTIYINSENEGEITDGLTYITFANLDSIPLSLWYNIDNDQNYWFKECTYTTRDSTIKKNIGIDRCQVLRPTKGGCSTVQINLNGLPTNIATVNMTAMTINSFTGGFAILNSNHIAIATRSFWDNKTPQSQNNILIHEIGHMIGMVPDDTDDNLDIGSNYYTGRGHLGPHCHAGVDHSLTADYTTTNDITATCIMYGKIGAERNTFCSSCANQVKKLDLTNTFK